MSDVLTIEEQIEQMAETERTPEMESKLEYLEAVKHKDGCPSRDDENRLLLRGEVFVQDRPLADGGGQIRIARCQDCAEWAQFDDVE